MVGEVDVLDALAKDYYQWGECEALSYRPDQPNIFGHHLITNLYDQCVESRILHPLFCGMTALHEDAICGYLATRPIVLMVERGLPKGNQSSIAISGNRRVVGFAFVTAFVGVPIQNSGPQMAGPRSAVGGYGMFRWAWGSRTQEICTMLGLCLLFNKYRLLSLHGQAYSHNRLTTRFMSKFGFRETGLIPSFLPERKPDGSIQLTDCRMLTLTKKTLEEYVTRQFLDLVK